MTVVCDADRLHTAEPVDFKVDVDEARLRVERVPDHLRDRAHRISLPGKPQQVVGFGLDVNGTRTATTPEHVRNHVRDLLAMDVRSWEKALRSSKTSKVASLKETLAQRVGSPGARGMSRVGTAWGDGPTPCPGAPEGRRPLWDLRGTYGLRATPPAQATSGAAPQGLGSGRHRVTGTMPGSSGVRPSK